MRPHHHHRHHRARQPSGWGRVRRRWDQPAARRSSRPIRGFGRSEREAPAMHRARRRICGHVAWRNDQSVPWPAASSRRKTSQMISWGTIGVSRADPGRIPWGGLDMGERQMMLACAMALLACAWRAAPDATTSPPPVASARASRRPAPATRRRPTTVSTTASTERSSMRPPPGMDGGSAEAGDLGCKKVDFSFVGDRSGSMQDEQ